MSQNLPLYDVPKYGGTVAGGAFAVALAARNSERLDLRDLPNPPSQAQNSKPR